MGSALVLWLHILAATLFVGPQAFLFMAAVPAMRTIDDVEARLKATRVVTSRFGWIGGGALLVLILTGIGNYMHASDTGLLDFNRYAFVLQLKLALVAVVVVLTLLHGGVLGRRLLRLQREGAGEAELAATRRWSIVLSSVVFVLSVAILLLAALLASDWSRR
ncbi:MAG: CopD family protein [Dehalococcoidia bacterium]|nr:CopD family protein [Dehalococcoidia bacterium]